jgi:hypothetical protein
MNSIDAVPVIAWFVVTMWRLTVVPKRLKLPLLRGPDYFFNSRVGPEFYQSAGVRILRQYQALSVLPM